MYQEEGGMTALHKNLHVYKFLANNHCDDITSAKPDKSKPLAFISDFHYRYTRSLNKLLLLSFYSSSELFLDKIYFTCL